MTPSLDWPTNNIIHHGVTRMEGKRKDDEREEDEMGDEARRVRAVKAFYLHTGPCERKKVCVRNVCGVAPQA